MEINSQVTLQGKNVWLCPKQKGVRDDLIACSKLSLFSLITSASTPLFTHLTPLATPPHISTQRHLGGSP